MLGNRRNRLGQARTVGAKHKLNAVLVDQTFGKLCATGRGRFIIVVDDVEHVVLAINRDAAGLVDQLDGKVIAALGVLTVGGIFAGQRDRRTQINRIALYLCIGRSRENKPERCRGKAELF